MSVAVMYVEPEPAKTLREVFNESNWRSDDYPIYIAYQNDVGVAYEEPVTSFRIDHEARRFYVFGNSCPQEIGS